MNIQTQLPCVVILTAIPAEYRAVRSHLSNLTEEVHKGTVYERGLFLEKGCQREVGIVPGVAGNAATATEAERAIAYFQPQVIFFVGVAGGLNRNMQLGDVVAATKVYGYESGKARTTFQTRPEMGRSTYPMEQRARAEARRTDWLWQIKGSQPALTPKVYVGPIAAGEKVIASTRSAIAQFLRVHYEDTLAVEMEGYGFFKAVHANHPIDALIIRGISDLINNKSEADAANYQDVAARHASAFAFEILTKFCIEKQFSSSQALKNPEQRPVPTFRTPHITDNSITMQNSGSIQAPVQVGNNNTINNVIPPKDEIAEGTSCLKRGQAALTHRNYTLARQYLGKARHLLAEDQAPEKYAQAHFLLALACLHGERPFGATVELWNQVEELMQMAIDLNPSHSYLYTFALFKRDFSSNGLKKSQLLREAQQLLQEAEDTSHVAVDEENIRLLWLCQPLLMQEAQAEE